MWTGNFWAVKTWSWRSTRRSSRCQQVLESLSSSRIFFRTFHKNNFLMWETWKYIIWIKTTWTQGIYTMKYIYILGTVISYLLISDTFLWSKSLISDSVINRYKQLLFPKTIFRSHHVEFLGINTLYFYYYIYCDAPLKASDKLALSVQNIFLKGSQYIQRNPGLALLSFHYCRKNQKWL